MTPAGGAFRGKSSKLVDFAALTATLRPRLFVFHSGDGFDSREYTPSSPPPTPPKTAGSSKFDGPILPRGRGTCGPTAPKTSAIGNAPRPRTSYFGTYGGHTRAAPPHVELQCSQEELTHKVRPRWGAEKLEQLIKDKILSKIEGYPANAAFRLFSPGGGKEITLQDFKGTCFKLLNVELTDVEAKQLFDKYDLDEGGTIDPHELILGIMPPPATYGQPPPRPRATIGHF